MKVTPRTQYLYGRSLVDLERREERGALHSLAATVVDLAPTASHADLRQAEYYQEMLDDLRTAVNAELAHHYASRVVRETNGDGSGVRRSQRIIRVQETELAAIDQLTDALSSRFPTSRIHCQDPDSLPVHRVHSSLATTDIVLAATASADS